MDVNDFLLTSSQSSQFSACLWDYNTLNVHKYYKSGGTVAPKCLEIVGQDYVLTGELGKPLLHVWPLNSQDVSKNIRLILPEPAICIAVCPKNVYLAVGISSKTYVWQLSSGKLLSVQQNHYQPVTCLKFSSNGEFLLIGGQDGMLVAYSVTDIIAVMTNFLAQSDVGQVDPLYVKNDHSMPIKDIHLGDFGRKSRFATVSSDQTCRVYSLLNGEPLLNLVFNEMLNAVVFDAPCWQMFVGTDSGNIRQFNMRNSSRTLTHHVDENPCSSFTGHKKKVLCLALNLANTVLASGSEDNFVFTWEIKSRQILKKIEHKSAITNIKFVLSYHNFFADSMKPKIVLKSLERAIDGKNDFIVSQLQTEDIEFSDNDSEDNSFDDRITSRTDLVEENRKLRIINKQLYTAALEITKKCHSE